MAQKITRDTTLRCLRENKLLDTRACNCLMRGGCDTVGDVLDLYNSYGLVEVRNIGYSARAHIVKFLKNNGFLNEEGTNAEDMPIEEVTISHEYSVSSNGRSARILIAGDVDSTFLDLVKLTLNQALEDEKEKLKLKEFEANPLTTKLEDVRPKLSVRSFNCLYRYGCKTVGDVLNLSLNDLDKVRNLGLKGKEEVVEAFSKYGKFKDED